MDPGDREIEERVLVALRRIVRAISLHSSHIQRRYGLTGPQLLLLREVARRDGAAGGEIARALNLSHATVTGILDRLEGRGLLTRKRSTQDKRRVLVALTEEGRGLLERAPPPLQTRFVDEFRKLGDWEQTNILSSLQRVATMMLAEQLDAAPVLMDGEGKPAEGDAVEFLERVESDGRREK